MNTLLHFIFQLITCLGLFQTSHQDDSKTMKWLPGKRCKTYRNLENFRVQNFRNKNFRISLISEAWDYPKIFNFNFLPKDRKGIEKCVLVSAYA